MDTSMIPHNDPANNQTIRLSISHNFFNKENRAPAHLNKYTGEMSNQWAFGAFKNVTWTAEQITRHILAGHTISVASLSGNWRHKKFFSSSQIKGLDFDNGVSVEQLASDPLIGTTAFLIYATPSSTPEKPRSRALFMLDASITDPEQYTRLLMRLMHHYGQAVDKQCKDCVRIFHGSYQAEHILQARALLIETLEALPPSPSELQAVEAAARRAQRASQPRTERNASYENNYARKAIRAEADTLSGTAKGGRHAANIRAAFKAGMHVGAGTIDYSTAYDMIYDAALSAGRPADEAARDTTDGLNEGRAQPYDYPDPPPDKPKRQRRSQQAAERKQMARVTGTHAPSFIPFEGDTLDTRHKANVEYLTPADFNAPSLAAYDILAASDMGTGKTTSVAKAFEKTDRFLSITYIRNLAYKLSDDLGTECYLTLKANDLRRVNRLTISIQSLWKVADQRYKVVHIDEVVKVFGAIGGKTCKGIDAIRAFQALKAIIRNADRVICTDAHLTPDVQRFIEELRGKERVLTCVNSYTRQRGDMHLYESAAEVTAVIEQLADEDKGVVAVATNSQKEARRLERMFSERYGEESVFAIYSDVSGEPERKAVIRDVNKRIGNYRVFIYSPSLASGIDIQANVRAVCAIFNVEPLPADEDHQMLNRCRNAAEYHIYIQCAEGKRETDAKAIFQLDIDNAQATAVAADFAANQLPTYTDEQAGLHRLMSMLKARRNASQNRFYDHFLTLAKGFKSITVESATNVVVMQARRAEASEKLRAIQKQDTLDATPLSAAEFEQLADNGQITPAARAGYRRWQIERAAGRDITPTLYDLLETSEQRTAVYTLRDVIYANENDLKAHDRAEQKGAISGRKHMTRRVRILRHLNKVLFGEAIPNAELRFEREHLEMVMTEFMGLFGAELHRLFERRSDKSTDAVPLLRWLLAKMGLKLESYQIMENRQRRRVYGLDAEQGAIMLDLAASSWARHCADKAITQNRDICITHDTGFKQHFHDLHLPGDYAEDLEAQRRIQANIDMLVSVGLWEKH